MNTEMTISELKKIIENLPDDAVVRISNGHAIWRVKDYEYEANPFGDNYTGIILTNMDMPK